MYIMYIAHVELISPFLLKNKFHKANYNYITIIIIIIIIIIVTIIFIIIIIIY